MIKILSFYRRIKAQQLESYWDRYKTFGNFQCYAYIDGRACDYMGNWMTEDPYVTLQACFECLKFVG